MHHENKLGITSTDNFFNHTSWKKIKDIIGTDIFFMILDQNNQKQSVYTIT
jgi:hypothetical protein